MASMLHASSINPFDSHEARAHRDDPEIVAMTNLVQAFHNDDVKKFERILQKNEGRIMDDEFVRDHVADLLRTIRTQVILRSIGPYTRIRLARIAKDLNDIPVEDVESLLVSLILNGKLEGQIDQVNGIFVKAPRVGGNGSDVTTDKTHFSASGGSIESRTTAAIVQLTAALEHLTEMTTKVTARGSIIASQ
jgi:COP9 signalosome complex subunit 2